MVHAAVRPDVPSQPVECSTAVARSPREPGLFLALAPMDGVTDWVHRELASRIGGVSMCVSEFVRVTDAVVPEKVFLRDVPELRRSGVTSQGTPVFVQILGGSAAAMAASARVAATLGAPGIDINFGCPAKRVNNHDGGASILRCPERAESITRAVRDAVPPHVPVTVKVRLGWSDSAGIVELAQRIERAGATWLTIHARTKQQMYAPPVDHEAVGRALRAVRIPVVANGDLTSPAALSACRQQSGASAFMIGRGALANARIFHELRGDVARDVTCETLQQYAALLLAGGFTEEGSLRRLKQWLGLGSVLNRAISPLFDAVKRCADLCEARRVLDQAASAQPGA
jgi:tRNA-dihydrouridine synthase C